MNKKDLVLTDIINRVLISNLFSESLNKLFFDTILYKVNNFSITEKGKYTTEYHPYIEYNSVSEPIIKARGFKAKRELRLIKREAKQLYKEKNFNEWLLKINVLKDKRKDYQEINQSITVNLKTRFGFNLNDFCTVLVNNLLILNSYRNMTNITKIHQTLFHSLPQYPIFTHNILDFINLLNMENYKLAIEGGICIISKGELKVKFNLQSEMFSFDWFTGELLQKPTSFKGDSVFDIPEELLRSARISDIMFYKPSITLQDFIDIYTLIFFSKHLNVPLVIGLPDKEYSQLFCSMFSPDPRTASKFNKVIEYSTNLVISVIHNISNRLHCSPVIHYSKNHQTQIALKKALCTIESSGYNFFSSNEYKRDISKSYLAMPSIPYFLLNRNHILEINNITEARSVVSCKKVFKDLKFSMIGIPFLTGLRGGCPINYDRFASKIYINDISKLNDLLSPNQIIYYKDYLRIVLQEASSSFEYNQVNLKDILNIISTYSN